MNFDLNLFSKKLKKLFKLQEYTETEFSNVSKISIERVRGFLDSEIIPNGDEILIISDIFKIDYKYLISNDSVTLIEKTEVFYRNNEGLISKEDKRIIADTLHMAAFYKYLTDMSGAIITTFSPRIVSKLHVEQGAEVALQLREVLGILDKQRGINPFRIARELGIQVFRRKLSNSSISGIHLHSKETGKVILINYNDDIYHQNFSLLHELAHSFFDVKENFRLSLEQGENTSDSKYVEMRANRFASTFLIPPTLAKEIKLKYKTNIEFINIANEFFVNPVALAIALKSNNQLDNETFNKLKSLKIKRADKYDAELKDLSPNSVNRFTKLQEQGISVNYFKKCYDAYYNKIITFSKLCEVLSLSPIEVYSHLVSMGVKNDVR